MAQAHICDRCDERIDVGVPYPTPLADIYPDWPGAVKLDLCRACWDAVYELRQAALTDTSPAYVSVLPFPPHSL